MIDTSVGYAALVVAIAVAIVKLPIQIDKFA
jgi:hypothetical protein